MNCGYLMPQEFEEELAFLFDIKVRFEQSDGDSFDVFQFARVSSLINDLEAFVAFALMVGIHNVPSDATCRVTASRHG